MADEYNAFVGGAFSMNPTFRERIESFHDAVQTSLTRLEAIYEHLDLFPDPTGFPLASAVKPVLTSNGADVFIAHGYDTAAKESVAWFVEKLDLNAIILHEQLNEGKTLIEKFVQHSNVGFAIVLIV